jgi:uncharacterized protein (DUF1697 family)
MGAKYIGLLRGINVGGKNKLPMRDLAAIFRDAGCADVTTYIQSGNVLFSATPATYGKVPVLVTKRIRADFGYQVPVIIRSARELEEVIRNNPFIGRGVDENLLHVMFLADKPDASQVRGLDAGRSAPDEFLVLDREIYLYLPNGVARSKLTNAYFDAKLANVSSGRNWRTVSKLSDLAARP